MVVERFRAVIYKCTRKENNDMKKISIIGSTGSIGRQSLDVVRSNTDKFKVTAISCNQNIDLLYEQTREFMPELVAIYSEKQALEFKKKIGNDSCFKGVEVMSGLEGLKAVAAHSDSSMVITAVVGMIGLVPTIEAIKKGKDIALSNKETMVAGGEIVSRLGARIIPVDSEHSAIFQCLNGEEMESVEKLILTASGGPFRGKTRKELLKVSKADALKHPNWEMGRKITIDSATLMNKGLEVIEARWLFGIDADRIDVIVHPQSIIHSMVEFKDKSVIAQLGNPDMRIPIQYALTYPQRREGKGIESLDLLKAGSLTFEKPDCETFPCLKLAYEALRLGGTYAAALNGANEVLVEQFLNDRIGFYDIPRYIEKTLERHSSAKEPGIEDILEADTWAREFVKRQIAL